MTVSDAAKILDVPPDASPEQREAAFRAQRSILEEKVAHAPTEGLKEKYREAIFRLTTARNVLQSSEDSSHLPTRRRAGVHPAAAPAAAPQAAAETHEETAESTAPVSTSTLPHRKKARHFLRARLPFAMVVLLLGIVAAIAWTRIQSANAPLVTDPSLFIAQWNDPPDADPDGQGDEWWNERSPRELLHLIGAAFAKVEAAARAHEAKAAEILAEYERGSYKGDLWRAERWHLHLAHQRLAGFLRDQLKPGNASPQIEEFRRAVVWFDSRLVEQLRASAEYHAQTISSWAEQSRDVDVSTALQVTSNPTPLTVTIESRFGNGEKLTITRRTPVDSKEFFGGGDAEIRVKHPGKPDFVRRLRLGSSAWIHADLIDPLKSNYN